MSEYCPPVKFYPRRTARDLPLLPLDFKEFSIILPCSYVNLKWPSFTLTHKVSGRHFSCNIILADRSSNAEVRVGTQTVLETSENVHVNASTYTVAVMYQYSTAAEASTRVDC